ncbi:hypothetical protein VTH06DRAFT_5821 [Thermothelomyces fergusii]
MSAQTLKDVFNQASDAEKDWLASALYYRDLESIRRDRPLLDPTKYASKKVDVYDGSAAATAQAATAAAATVSYCLRSRGGAAPDRSPPPSDSDHKSGMGQRPWLLGRVLTKATTISLSEDDDDGQNIPAAPPGPLSHMRLDIPKIRHSIGYTKPFAEQFPDEIEAAKADFLSTGYDFANQESLFDAPDWLGDRRKFEGRTVLFRGFPMVEDVTFLKHPNYWQSPQDHGKVIADGQCYWTSLGLLLYGSAHAWLRVKAEHLRFLEKVLTDPSHPRHAFYSRENLNFGDTHATGPGGLASRWSGRVNLWERLQIPGCWANEDLCQLTADVYGVFLVLYKYDTSNQANAQWRGKVYDMKTYGAYNNRHIFLCYYLENHFQPMVPNEYYASEFKLPRLTLSNTDRYHLVSRRRTRRARDGPGHHWRAQPRVVPSLAWPSFEPEHLARAAGYGPYAGTSLPYRRRQPSSRPAAAPHHDPSGRGKRPAADPPGGSPPPPPKRARAGAATTTNDDDGGGGGTDPDLAGTVFRAASKTLLGRVRAGRLRRWCLDLELAAGDDVVGWRRERCARALVDAGALVRVVRAGGGADAVVVGEELEARGVEVVRLPSSSSSMSLSSASAGGGGD